MSDNDDGGPAFPMPISNGGYSIITGMSLRDYFAAKAMQAMVANYSQTMRGIDDAQHESDSDITTPCRELMLDLNHVTGEYEGAKEIASDAYVIADAMLAARATATPAGEGNDGR